jgi:hypothetical protein
LYGLEVVRVTKVYASPVKAPEWEQYERDGRFDIKLMEQVDEKFLDDLRAWLKRSGYKQPLAGEIVRWPRGDGYAQYMVLSTKPLALIHLPLGDAWQMDSIFLRGLRASDIRQQVERQRKMAELFSSNKS